MAEVQKDTLGSTEDTLRFIDMVGLFGTQAMISLGKLANPAIGKAERNLPAARLFIDTLEMIERKTQGNLSSDETKVLHATLTDLRLMYAEEAKAPAAESSKPEEKKSEAGEPKTGDESKVKFHKKYE
jgi:hypothetical protein